MTQETSVDCLEDFQNEATGWIVNFPNVPVLFLLELFHGP